MTSKAKQKVDIRIRRTKRKLVQAFGKMLTEMPFEDISVNALCEAANVRRATFYKHYADKYAFLKYFICVLREKFDRIVWRKGKPDATSGYYVKYLKGILSFVNDNEKMMNNILSSNSLATIISIIQEQNFNDTCDRLRKSVEEGMDLSAPVETVAAFLTGGIAYIIIAWLKSGKTSSVESVISDVTHVINRLTGIDCKTEQ